jgi:hypothetical protein
LIIISLSSPIIEDPISVNEAQFEMNIPERNQHCAEYHIKYGSEIKVHGKNTYLISNLDTRSLAFVEDGKTQYLCYYKEYHNRQYKYAIQLVVWQDPNNKGFAQIMLDWFINQYDYVLLSDTQFPRGMEMYAKYISNNLNRVHTFVKYQNKHIAILNIEQFNALITKIWSRNHTNKNVRILMTTKPLDFTNT